MVKFTAFVLAYVFGALALKCVMRSEMAETVGRRVGWGAGAFASMFLTLYAFLVVTFS